MAVSLLLPLLAALTASLPSAVLGAPDNQGKEFILGFTDNSFSPSIDFDLQLYFSTSSNIPAIVTVTMPLFNPNFTETVTVTRGNASLVELPRALRGSGIERSNKAVLVQSTEEVSVYAVNMDATSTDAYIVLPVDVLGQKYYAMTYRNDPVIMVIATEDDTQVSIKWPPFRPDGIVNFAFEGQLYRNDDTLTTTLDKFHTLHINQRSTNSDFIGAYITSTKPIAAISGNRRVPIPINAYSSDHLTEMLMPVSTWGKDFVSTSTPARGIGDIYRIVASENDTMVNISGIGTFLLPVAGGFQELDRGKAVHAKMTASKPVMIAMFTKSWQNDGPYQGDPAMTLLLPEPQYASDYTWAAVSAPNGEFINMAVVVIENSEKDDLQLDGNHVTWNEEQPVNGSSKVHLWTVVTPGSHNLYHPDPLVTFMLLATGTRNYDSYAFLGGMRLAPINAECNSTCGPPGDIVDNDCDGRVDEELANDIDDDGDGRIDEDLAQPPRMDGQWGSWSSWGPCSVSCGRHGVKLRTRECNDPAPANNGLDCQGSCAQAAMCRAGSCPMTVRNRTCDLTCAHVDTFANIPGSFNYNCLFKAATLNKYKILGRHRLTVDIFVAYKDRARGKFCVSNVTVVIQEICLHPAPTISTFNVSAQTIRDVFFGKTTILNPKDLWTIDDKGGYMRYLCFGYNNDNGQVSFSIRTRRDRCTQVLTFRPKLSPESSGDAELVITTNAHMLSRDRSVRFPNTLCSGQHDRAFDRSFMGLETVQQKILYALLDQNVEQPKSDIRCVAAVQAFHNLNKEEKKKAAERCDMTPPNYLADCIRNRFMA